MPDQPDLAATGRRIRQLYAQGKTEDEVRAALAAEDAAQPVGGQPAPLTAAAIAKMPKAEQRRLAQEDWSAVKSALTGRPPVEQPLSAEELTPAGLKRVARQDPARLDAHFDQVSDAMKRRTGGGPR